MPSDRLEKFIITIWNERYPIDPVKGPPWGVVGSLKAAAGLRQELREWLGKRLLAKLPPDKQEDFRHCSWDLDHEDTLILTYTILLNGEQVLEQSLKEFRQEFFKGGFGFR